MDDKTKLILCRLIGRLDGANEQMRFLLKNRTPHDDMAWAQLRSVFTATIDELLKLI